MRNTRYLRYRRILMIVKASLKIIILVLIIYIKLRTLILSF